LHCEKRDRLTVYDPYGAEEYAFGYLKELWRVDILEDGGISLPVSPELEKAPKTK